MRALWLTGLRAREFGGVRIEDVSWAERTIAVERGEGGKRREIQLPVEPAQALRIHVGDRQAGPVFISNRRAAYSARRAQRLVKETQRPPASRSACLLTFCATLTRRCSAAGARPST